MEENNFSQTSSVADELVKDRLFLHHALDEDDTAGHT